jgi:radical SAM superfamily enzyme YgiQ (UPF0313 family)
MSKNNANILIVDLNNEAPFPTLAVGYLSTPLKQSGYKVDVFNPLAFGVSPLVRDVEETFINYVAARVRFASHPLIEWANEFIYKAYSKVRFRPTSSFRKKTSETINSKTVDLILVTSYLQYDQLLKVIAQRAHEQNIPLLLGGPFFNMPRVVEQWINIKGVTAVFGGEPEFVLEKLVSDMLEGTDISLYPGVFLNNGKLAGKEAPPLKQLDKLPIPDFDYFHWPNKEHRIIPIMAGRGCGWGKCLFCSDVITASTRTFRSRQSVKVLEELSHQSKRYESSDFIFFDSKLNSDLGLWYDLIDNIDQVIENPNWVATLHVDGKGENGLDKETLMKASKAGLRRVSFGLETGSQKLNDTMLKGTRIDRTSEFLTNAREAGISVRTTIMLGYPGETYQDIKDTIDFLKHHESYLDRVHLSRFKAIPGTEFEQRLIRKPEKYASLKSFGWNFLHARASYRYAPENKNEYRRAKRELIKLVHAMNKKSLVDTARQFNGMM